MGSLRSLLVDLYPASIDELGLQGALSDLVASLRSRGIHRDAAGGRLRPRARRPAPGLPRGAGVPAQRGQARRRHGGRGPRDVGRHRAGVCRSSTTATASTWGTPTRSSASGHFGIRIMSDLASEAGATLRVASGPTWDKVGTTEGQRMTEEADARVTVAIVDDHPLVRAGLRSVLEAAGDIRVVAEASDGDEVPAMVAAALPRRSF